MEGKAYLKLNKAGAKRYPELRRQGFAEFLEVNPNIVDSATIISHPRRHTFAGYYDLQNISPNGEKMFYLSVPHHASPKYNKAWELISYGQRSILSRVRTTRPNRQARCCIP